MHGYVAHFDLHVERDNVEPANFGAASSNPLDFGDHAPAHKGLKRIGGRVPERGQQRNQTDSNDKEQKFPPARRAGGRLRHRVCAPFPAPGAPGTLTLLSERRDCSQEIISSLTFSSVSNSRILTATSAEGISTTMDGFSCGTNLSR